MVTILYIGDVSAKPGREILAEILPKLRKEHDIDLIVAGIENLAHGRGATIETVKEVMSYGVDFMTGKPYLAEKRLRRIAGRKLSPHTLSQLSSRYTGKRV